jgi:hypothetical protein
MPLSRVTISGADNGVDPAELIELSAQFPFVEWGVLFSEKKAGEPRYPTLSWIEKLETLSVSNKINLSLHLCGKSARDTISGNDCWIKAFTTTHRFGRYQLNGSFPVFGNALFPVHQCELVGLVRQYSFVKFIFQAKDEEVISWCGFIKNGLSLTNITALFDGSGGKGIEPFSWPVTPLDLKMGFAGGINPENVINVLKDIGPRDYSFWIDMESGVRTDNKFDLVKVKYVLKHVEKFVT